MAKCEVMLNDYDCEWPGALDDGTAGTVRTKCYRCGQSACRSCSSVRRTWFPRRAIRICRDCVEYERP